MKVAISDLGCIKSNAKKDRLIELMKVNDIERSTSLEDSDYLLYVTCECTGDSIKLVRDELTWLLYNAERLNLKVIVVGCIVSNKNYTLKELEESPYFTIIDESVNLC